MRPSRDWLLLGPYEGLSPLNFGSAHVAVTVMEVVRAVAAEAGLGMEVLMSRYGPMRNAAARHLVMYVARRMTNKSYPQIGRALGGRDHSTVIKGEQAAKRRLAADTEYAALAARCEVRILGGAAE